MGAIRTELWTVLQRRLQYPEAFSTVGTIALKYISLCKEYECTETHNRQKYRDEPEGDDGVEQPPELAAHHEVCHEGDEGEVPHDPAG